MKIEEAIVYVIASRNGGMTTDQIAEAINRQKLHVRKDGLPVTSKQVYAVMQVSWSVCQRERQNNVELLI